MAHLLKTPAQGGVALPTTLVLAHGAGAPMDSLFMQTVADLLAQRGIEVVRFEFTFMAGRRLDGKRRPAPKAEKLQDEFRRVIDTLRGERRLLIGGKSLGGRVASLVAGDLHDQGAIAGLVCLGYPFHPSGKPERLRTARLEHLHCPTLIVQGEADPLGMRAEVETYRLSPAIQLHWIGRADHDLAPKAGHGVTKAQARQQAWAQAADAVAAFAARL